ncbi:Deformed epidermal autoregulatory factor 1 [Eumeta japonica]|uniref:Deformed epidermal autoregulatory factor 1 n=1 Tax=Eumeta variegata TaxID=151549 RepID=A0A4C1SLI2_EUMVA|nr:Deformed epidermal autoregulatory factor 1 [Eumeta japonica]
MEQDPTEMHLSRIRDVKELAVLSDEARDVVKEEVILESSGHQLETKVHMVTSSNENSGGSGGNVVSVPVSLPIGSMIAGGAVVGSVGGDLKTIVIQQQQQSDVVGMNHDGSGSNNSHDSTVTGDQMMHGPGSGCGSASGVSWTETSQMEIFPIRCKTTSAELYRSKLGSGGRGRCVKYKDKWLTPSEFEQTCGRGSSKDWKRSIKYGGKSLQSLIDEGTLTHTCYQLHLHRLLRR